MQNSKCRIDLKWRKAATYLLYVRLPAAGSFDTTADFDLSSASTGPVALSSDSTNGRRLCVSVGIASAAVIARVLDLLVLALVGLVAGCHRISMQPSKKGVNILTYSDGN